MRNQQLRQQKLARAKKLAKKITRKHNILKSLSIDQAYAWKKTTYYAVSKKFKQKKDV